MLHQRKLCVVDSESNKVESIPLKANSKKETTKTKKQAKPKKENVKTQAKLKKENVKPQNKELVKETVKEITKEPIKEEELTWDNFIQTIEDESEIKPTINVKASVKASVKQDVKQNLKTTDLQFLPDKEIKFISDNHHTDICTSCKKKMYYYDSVLICNNCGEEAVQKSFNTAEEDFSTSALTECNINTYSAMSIKMVGKNVYNCNRKLYQACANYSRYRKNNTLKTMIQWNNNSTKQHIPKYVIKEARDMFAEIVEHGYVFRGDGKNGVLSACLYYKCYANGLSKTPTEIAQFSGIEEKFHSFGDRVLHDLHHLGIINIPMKINPIADYVERYMELLNIPKKYKQFVIDLIDRAERKNIHILHDSKNSTKAMGAIYMLIQRVPSLRNSISKDKMDTEIGISKTTFIRYYDVLCKHYKLIKIIFKKHSIPMPITWKQIEA